MRDTVYVLVFEGFADWQVALALAEIRPARGMGSAQRRLHARAGHVDERPAGAARH